MRAEIEEIWDEIEELRNEAGGLVSEDEHQQQSDDDLLLLNYDNGNILNYDLTQESNSNGLDLVNYVNNEYEENHAPDFSNLQPILEGEDPFIQVDNESSPTTLEPNFGNEIKSNSAYWMNLNNSTQYSSDNFNDKFFGGGIHNFLILDFNFPFTIKISTS
uniref:Uncharacterized protein n=1 Tax=Clytia hemisphaerica TaxID=252671 RepID=A0A7M5XK02_9CNID